MPIHTGIIDSKGLESFADKSKSDFPYKMRAMLNQHRLARTYEVEISLEDADKFDKKIRKEKKWKEHAKELQKNKTFKWTM